MSTWSCNSVGKGAQGPGQALSLEQALAAQEVFVGTTAGSSMWPMLRNRQDTVVVEPAVRPLEPGDVALYRRGDSYILHRVVQRRAGGYLILGDNCLAYEQVPEGQVLGVLTGFYRGERPVNMQGRAYGAYVRFWRVITPVRRLLLRARGRVARVLRAARKAMFAARRKGRA